MSSISTFLIVFLALAIVIGIPSMIVYCHKKSVTKKDDTVKREDISKCRLCILVIFAKCCSKRNKMQVDPGVSNGAAFYDTDNCMPETDGVKVPVKSKFNVSRQN